MSLPHVLAAGRRAAERLMTDSCVIRRSTGTTTDKSTGVKLPIEKTVYSGDGPGGGGPCRVKELNQQGQRVDAGEVSVTLLRFELQLPIATSVGLQEGDVAEMTASIEDPDLVGRKFRIHGLSHASQKTKRALQVEEVT